MFIFYPEFYPLSRVIEGLPRQSIQALRPHLKPHAHRRPEAVARDQVAQHGVRIQQGGDKPPALYPPRGHESNRTQRRPFRCSRKRRLLSMRPRGRAVERSAMTCGACGSRASIGAVRGSRGARIEHQRELCHLPESAHGLPCPSDPPHVRPSAELLCPKPSIITTHQCRNSCP
jgi:hypothetical protein